MVAPLFQVVCVAGSCSKSTAADAGVRLPQGVSYVWLSIVDL